MRCLNGDILNLLAALAFSAFLTSLPAQWATAQDDSPRSSRYRLVDPLEKISIAKQLPAKNYATAQQIQETLPQADFATSAAVGALSPHLRMISRGQADTYDEARVKFAGYAAKTPGRTGRQQTWPQTQHPDPANNYDTSPVYLDQSAPPAYQDHAAVPDYQDHAAVPAYLDHSAGPTYSDHAAGPAATKFPFRDQFQAFPPRHGFGTNYGEEPGSFEDRGDSSAIFGTHRDECCDEWSEFSPAVAADYLCGCGGLKTNPGHCLCKRGSSKESCDNSRGRNRKCGCDKKSCDTNDCQTRRSSRSAKRASRRDTDCSSGCGSESESECACGCDAKTPTQRRWPLISSLNDKPGLGERRTLRTKDAASQSCECQACR